MPFELKLPVGIGRNLWKVKIREKETVEPPHVTIIRKTDSWRISLRDMKFMDKVPDPNDVPNEIVEYIRQNVVNS